MCELLTCLRRSVSYGRAFSMRAAGHHAGHLFRLEEALHTSSHYLKGVPVVLRSWQAKGIKRRA